MESVSNVAQLTFTPALPVVVRNANGIFATSSVVDRARVLVNWTTPNTAIRWCPTILALAIDKIYHFCTLTLLDPIYSAAARGDENFGENAPPANTYIISKSTKQVRHKLETQKYRGIIHKLWYFVKNSPKDTPQRNKTTISQISQNLQLFCPTPIPEPSMISSSTSNFTIYGATCRPFGVITPKIDFWTKPCFERWAFNFLNNSRNFRLSYLKIKSSGKWIDFNKVWYSEFWRNSTSDDYKLVLYLTATTVRNFKK